jgi:hypothetical protein
MSPWDFSSKISYCFQGRVSVSCRCMVTDCCLSLYGDRLLPVAVWWETAACRCMVTDCCLSLYGDRLLPVAVWWQSAACRCMVTVCCLSLYGDRLLPVAVWWQTAACRVIVDPTLFLPWRENCLRKASTFIPAHKVPCLWRQASASSSHWKT